MHDDRRLFEFLVLEGAQAGLSWLTILKKREAFRLAFAGFDMDAVAVFDDADIKRLLLDAGSPVDKTEQDLFSSLIYLAAVTGVNGAS